MFRRMPIRWPFRIAAAVIGLVALLFGLNYIVNAQAAFLAPRMRVVMMTTYGLLLCVLAALFLALAFARLAPAWLMRDGRGLEDPPAAP